MTVLYFNELHFSSGFYQSIMRRCHETFWAFVVFLLLLLLLQYQDYKTTFRQTNMEIYRFYLLGHSIEYQNIHNT